MIETILRRFIEYKKRRQAVIILTAVTMLAVVWPAVDEYTAAGGRLRNARDELKRAQREVQQLPEYSQVFLRKKDELRKLEMQGVTGTVAQSLRGDLVQMVRQTGCMMRSIRLGEPSSRVWMEEDDPVANRRLMNRSKETPFKLVTRQLSVSITGPMASIHQFLSRVHSVDRMIHTRQISMRRSDRDENETLLEMDVLLFHLARQAAT